MRHWKMAYKLGTGLGSILLITCLLGYVALQEMDSAIVVNESVAEKFLPELTGMAALQREFYAAVLDMRTFTFTSDQKTYDEGLGRLTAARAEIGKLQRLADKHADLRRLATFLTAFGRTLEDSIDLAEQSRIMVMEANAQRQRVSKDALKAMEELHEVSLFIREAIKQDAAQGNTTEIATRTTNMALAEDIITAIVEVRVLVWQAAYANDGALLHSASQKVHDQLPLIAQLGQHLRTEAARANLTRADSTLRSYNEGIADIVRSWEKLESINKQSSELSAHAEKLITESADTITHHVVSTSASDSAVTRGNQRIFMGMLAGLLLLGAAIAFVLTRSITRPLTRCTSFAQEVAAGRLDADLPLNQRDEVGQLAAALRAIPQMLRGIMTEYASVAQRIAVGELTAQGAAKQYPGEFSALIQGTNAALGRLCGIVEHMPTAVVMLDVQLKATYMNNAARTLAGMNYQGRSAQELFAPADHGTPTDGLQQALRTSQPSGGETVMRPPHWGGKALDVDYSAVPLLDQEGRLTCILLCITDTTAIRQAQRTIVRVAGEAVEIAGRVASTAGQLSAQVEQSGKGTAITSERIAETATSMEQMNSTVLEVARSAGTAANVAADAKHKAEQGAGIVNTVVRHMAEVEQQSLQVKGDMEILGQQAASIDAIMNVISDIADQTNLLALNAAIEAARAGEAGRGFAVVADEVRKLAEKTVHATVQVGDAIRGIQQSAEKNIQNVDASGQKITEATFMAQQAGDALKGIVDLVDASSDQVHTIAIASEEQSSTSEEINRSLGVIHNASQETALAMAEASQAVVELSAQAQNLAQLIDGMQRG